MGTVIQFDGYRRHLSTEQMKSILPKEVEEISDKVMDAVDKVLNETNELNDMSYEEAQCISLVHECIIAFLLKKRNQPHIFHSLAEEIIELDPNDKQAG